jgi:Nucleotidyl transferase AbiEii toxin, Type IV TA system
MGSEMLVPTLEKLPPSQRTLWPELSEVPRDFVLYGGTALALRLGHRISEDFDFFSPNQLLPDDLERRVPFLREAVRLQSSPNTLVSSVDRGGAVKVSFFGGLNLRRVQDPELAEGPGILVASLLDLAAAKVQVVQDRAESKDYRDVDRLLKEGIDLGHALAAARAVFGPAFNPLLSLKALSYFGDGDLATLEETLRARLLAAVAEVDLGRLPDLQPLPGGLLP